MRSLLGLLGMFRPATAAENARRELVHAQSQHRQTTALARRIATIDTIAGRQAIEGPGVPDAA